MKAYKGFNKDMTCTPDGRAPFQYKEGETYEEPEAELCKKGFHACLEPLDCLNYYDICNSVYHEVELEDVRDQREKSDTKVCGKKIKIGAKLSIKDIVKASVDFTMESVKKEGGVDPNDFAQLASSGDSAQLASSGDSAKLASSGYSAKLASSGDSAQLASSGYSAQLASSGDSAKLASSGYFAQLASSGYFAKLASSGDSAKLASSGKNSVVMSAGINGKVKAAVGNWIAIAEWKIKDSHFVPVGIVAAKVDGEKIKADTWYKCENGQLVEAEEE
nr:MAG TPA: hypothetical protein [Caudoviricetes sp.]